MLEEIASYLEKLGYTSEEQGGIEKYLVVCQKGRPLGFILSDGSLCLVEDAEGAEGVRDAIGFLQKNRGLQPVGNGEFLVSSHRRDQLTTFYDVGAKREMFATYLVDKESGEVRHTVYQSCEDAEYHFVTESGQINLSQYLPRKKGLSERMREKLLSYLLSKSDRQPERP